MSLTDLGSPQGIDRFYYATAVPERGTAIAQVTSSIITPAQKVNILNNTYLPGNLDIWIYSDGDSPAPNFSTGDYNISTLISGSMSYILGNKFFEITDQFDQQGNPLYYSHTFISNFGTIIVGSATVLDLQGNIIETSNVNSSTYYHSMDGKAYQIRYYDSSTGVTETVLLNYAPAVLYNLTGNVLSVNSIRDHSIRFIKESGYKVTAPYDTPSYLPWFPRISFPIGNAIYEYNNQYFDPKKPYMRGSYVVGTVVSDLNQNFPNIIEFDRKNIYVSSTNRFPDILIFDKYNNFKYALQGSTSGKINRGNLYHWRGMEISNIDPYKARVQVTVDIESTDIIYGFYSYLESDFIFTSLDLNPITNPVIKDNIIYFYYRSGVDSIYYQIFSPSSVLLSSTNDITPPTWVYNTTLGVWEPSDASIIFSTIEVGNGYNAKDFTITDARTRGGGLVSGKQSIPLASNFWDLGYLDGKPYPIGGTMVIYLPLGLQNILSKDQIKAKVLNIIPEGVYPVIVYYE